MLRSLSLQGNVFIRHYRVFHLVSPKDETTCKTYFIKYQFFCPTHIDKLKHNILNQINSVLFTV